MYEPEIPGNAGAIARLCGATGAPLHFIGRLGFSLRHPDARRVGMDYWEAVDLQRHINYGDFHAATADHRLWMLTTRGQTSLWKASFSPGDILLLGPESRGLPADLLATAGGRTLRIPIVPGARSLNLATAAAITLYEALRQVGWGPETPAGNTPAV